ASKTALLKFTHWLCKIVTQEVLRTAIECSTTQAAVARPF
ncbi:MAG: hypothetical protein ACI9G1_002563, partial [Pirellulaceae bacterium]